ncbi:kinetochore protein Spc25-like [Oscarella lobularis]|uniref:kinetochore protein Spc25-like n=1 Tax=Oscarella lobularis TaxID=121494 RepID=UPI0033135D41
MSSNINELELWSREEVKRAMDALKEERNRCLEAASSLTVHWREKGRSIEESVLVLKELQEEGKSAVESKKEADQIVSAQIRDRKRDLHDLTLLRDDLKEKVSTTKITCHELERQIEKLESKNDDHRDKAVEEQKDYIAKAWDLLGISFRKISGGKIQAVFRCLKADDDNYFGYVIFSLDSEKRDYKVHEVKPDIDDVERLIEQLNASNNLSRFFSAVRNQMKKQVE